MNTEKEFFGEDELNELAVYIGMSLPEFLEFRKKGKFGVQPRPLNPTPVYFRAHVDRWLAGGRPVASMSPDPSGVLAVNPDREGGV